MKDLTQEQEQAQVDIYKHFYDITSAKPRQVAKLALWSTLYGASPELIKKSIGIK